jgi:DNA topoisomerase-3
MKIYGILNICLKTGPHVVDNRKVSDHHAIIPTEQPLQLQQLNDVERKIYDLVVKRFLAVFMPAHEFEQITLKVQIANEIFIARGRRVVIEGWREVLSNFNLNEEQETNSEDESLSEQTFPNLTKGQTFTIQELRKTRGETKPPARFNEASLLSAMENPSQFLEKNEQQHAQTLKDTGGLGTVATRADIIEKLFASFLIEKSGKEIRITRKGEQLLQLVPADLRSPLLTAQWERKLERIANGQLDKLAFVTEMYQYATQAVREISSSSQTYRHDNITRTPCPDCGKPMLDVKDKKGRLFVCQDRECGSRQRVAQTSNARCPNCRKKLELRGTGDGQTFHCVCGHREKLSAFLERKQANTGVSKREVDQYMKQQQQETNQQPINSALADALANLKLSD